MIYLITGAKNEGKTKTQNIICSTIKNKPDKIQQNGEQIEMDGFICNKCFLPKPLHSSIRSYKKDLTAGNYHIGYNLIRVSDQTITPFIRLTKYVNTNLGMDFSYGPFTFLNNGIDTGKQILQECYLKKTKNVIIDEIGKLELNGKVFADEIRHLIEYSYIINLFVSVRTEFLGPIVEKFGINNFIEIQANFPEKKIEEALEDVT